MIHPSGACILIPAYNEEKKIGGVVREILKHGFRVVVVDDGSSDGTAAAVRDAGAQVLVSPVNQGKGAAIRKGFDWALENGFEAVVVIDADGQHDPNELRRFLNTLTPSEADIVVGDRMSRPEGMPFIRRLTNQIMSLFVSSVAGQSVPDSQCGYRAFTQEALRTLRLRTDRFEIESEMLMQAGRKGLKIRSIPIASVYRDETSHIRPLRDTLRFLVFFIRFIFSPY